jgi:hypothetical protein
MPLLSQAMPEPAPDDGHEAPRDTIAIEALQARARERAEAEAAVGEVMTNVAKKAAQVVEQQQRRHAKPKPLKLILLGSMVLLNLYLWLGNPEWLRFKEPAAPALEYYQDSWKMAAYLQAQRIEEYRKEEAKLPAKVDQVRHPVHGVDYVKLDDQRYQLAAGVGRNRVIYDSNQPINEWVGRSIIRLGLLTNGVGR